MKYLGIIILLLVFVYGVGHLISLRSQEFRQESLKQRMVFAAKKTHVVTGMVAVVIVIVYFLRLLIHMIQSW